jgi:hypothetical protein
LISPITFIVSLFTTNVSPDGNSSLALSRASAWLPNHALDERPCWCSLASEPGTTNTTIARLEDEDLVTSREEGDRHIITLTSEGRAQVEEHTSQVADRFSTAEAQPRF